MVLPRSIDEFTALRAHVSGWRVLLVSKRGRPDASDHIEVVLGIRCLIEDAAGKPRRRRSLVERIERRTYDAALVAQGFVRHADSDHIAAACRRAEIPYIAVGKGCFAEIAQAMRTVLLPPPSI